jgi:hypothetical protein
MQDHASPRSQSVLPRATPPKPPGATELPSINGYGITYVKSFAAFIILWDNLHVLFFKKKIIRLAGRTCADLHTPIIAAGVTPGRRRDGRAATNAGGNARGVRCPVEPPVPTARERSAHRVLLLS